MRFSDVKASLRGPIWVEALTGPAVDLRGGERFQRSFRLADHGPSVGERKGSDECGRVEYARLHVYGDGWNMRRPIRLRSANCGKFAAPEGPP